MALCERMVFSGEDLAESLRLAAEWVKGNVGNYEIYSIEAIGTSIVIYREV